MGKKAVDRRTPQGKSSSKASSAKARKLSPAAYRASARNIETHMHQLFDELAATLQKGPNPGQLEGIAARLWKQANHLTAELEDSNKLKVEEKTALLQDLSDQAEALILTASDAIVASEQERWSGDLEAVHAHLQEIHQSLDALEAPHATEEQREGATERVQTLLASADERLLEAHEGIRVRAHVKEHPVYAKLVNIHTAVANAKASLGQVPPAAVRAKLSGGDEGVFVYRGPAVAKAEESDEPGV